MDNKVISVDTLLVLCQQGVATPQAPIQAVFESKTESYSCCFLSWSNLAQSCCNWPSRFGKSTLGRCSRPSLSHTCSTGERFGALTNHWTSTQHKKPIDTGVICKRVLSCWKTIPECCLNRGKTWRNRMSTRSDLKSDPMIPQIIEPEVTLLCLPQHWQDLFSPHSTQSKKQVKKTTIWLLFWRCLFQNRSPVFLFFNPFLDWSWPGRLRIYTSTSTHTRTNAHCC